MYYLVTEVWPALEGDGFDTIANGYTAREWADHFATQAVKEGALSATVERITE